MLESTAFIVTIMAFGGLMIKLVLLITGVSLREVVPFARSHHGDSQTKTGRKVEVKKKVDLSALIELESSGCPTEIVYMTVKTQLGLGMIDMATVEQLCNDGLLHLDIEQLKKEVAEE